MSKTRIAVLGLAIGSAVVAAVLAKGFLGQKPEKQVVEINKVKMAQVLVAAKDIKMGDRVGPANMTWQDWPANSLRPYMVSKVSMPDALSKLKNARARADLFEGEPLSEKKLVMPDSAGFMAAILPKGMRAISVRISAETGAGGFILPNDRVDVLITRKQSSDGGKNKTITEPVLRNVRVLAIDQTFTVNEKGEKVKVGQTATLELEPYMAEILAMSESSGQLTLALRSLADNGDSKLGDDGPRLAERFLNNGTKGQVTIYRFGVQSSATLNN